LRVSGFEGKVGRHIGVWKKRDALLPKWNDFENKPGGKDATFSRTAVSVLLGFPGFRLDEWPPAAEAAIGVAG
jgi:hypothetical protein